VKQKKRGGVENLGVLTHGAYEKDSKGSLFHSRPNPLTGHGEGQRGEVGKNNHRSSAFHQRRVRCLDAGRLRRE